MNIEAFIEFLQNGIWRMRAHKLDKKKSFFIVQLRTIVLAFRSFSEDKCVLRASALTFYTLLSIVPVVAMAFGIAKGFDMEKLLEKQLAQNFEGHEEALDRILQYSRNMLENANGGVIAGFGVLLLLWTVIKLLSNIESSFNDIWGVKEGRSIGRKFSDYLALILICPILLALAGSATVFIASHLKKLTDYMEFYGVVLLFVNSCIRMLPFFVTWLLFLFLYMFLPNTKVNFRPALSASFIAGIFYQIVQILYVNCQFALSKSNAIYGSLAALPFFLVWVQTSWLIVLFGAEIAFSAQNVDTYELEPDCLKASSSLKFAAALMILAKIVKDFDEGKTPPDENELSADLDIPIRLLRDIIFECEKSGLIVEAEKKIQNGKIGYHPALDSSKFTVAFVAEKFLNHGLNCLSDYNNEKLEKIRNNISSIISESAEKKAKIHVKELL